jgi:hypothetical protein
MSTLRLPLTNDLLGYATAVSKIERQQMCHQRQTHNRLDLQGKSTSVPQESAAKAFAIA